jgi:hypothetical protein
VQTFAEKGDTGVGGQQRISQKVAEGGTHGNSASILDTVCPRRQARNRRGEA